MKFTLSLVSFNVLNTMSILAKKRPKTAPFIFKVPVMEKAYPDKSIVSFLSVPVGSCAVAGGMFTVRGVFRNSLLEYCECFCVDTENGFVSVSTR